MSREDEAGQARSVAARAAARELGPPVSEPRPQTGGLSNQVFEVEAADGRFVMRLSPEPEKVEVFARERRVAARVRMAGVPSPEVVAIGELEGWAYMVAAYIGGVPATDHPRRLEVLGALGRLAAHIHGIGTEGCGCDFGWRGEPVREPSSWRTWLADVLGARERLALLRAHRLIDGAQQSALLAQLEAVEDWSDPPVLNHGDLRLKNVMVDDAGAIQGLIDWEACASVVGPHWDLSLALHDLSVDAKEAFLDGYGLDAEAIRSAAPAWRLFNALNYAPEAERLAERRDAAGMARLRLRLSGALDLYCPVERAG